MILQVKLTDICKKFFENLKDVNWEQHQIYCTILYFIHLAANLSTLYLNWSDLKSHERRVLNSQIKLSIKKHGNIIYPPVIRAFQYWDMIQDHLGAPGFNCNPLEVHLSNGIDKAVVSLLLCMEDIIDQMLLKRKLLQEINSYTTDHSQVLNKHKRDTVYKNSNRKRSCLTKITKEGNRKEEDDSGEHSTDLSGSGDMSWSSE